MWCVLLATLLTAFSSGDKKSYYTIPDLQLTWHDALLTCRSFGMHMLSFDAQEDYTEVKKMIKKYSAMFNVPSAFNVIYIGGKIRSDCTDSNRMNMEECWFWMSNGLPMDCRLSRLIRCNGILTSLSPTTSTTMRIALQWEPSETNLPYSTSPAHFLINLLYAKNSQTSILQELQSRIFYDALH